MCLFLCRCKEAQLYELNVAVTAEPQSPFMLALERGECSIFKLITLAEANRVLPLDNRREKEAASPPACGHLAGDSSFCHLDLFSVDEQPA